MPYWSVDSMLSCLIAVILLSAAAFSLSLYLKKSFTQLLAPVLFCVIFVLYGFYLANALFLGRIAVILLLLLTVLYTALRAKPTPADWKALLCRRSAVLYGAGILVFVLFSCTKFVSLYDSLRLWGAYPKLLHSTGLLQLGEDALLYPVMQSYPPGMPLLCYFFSGFSPVFPENALFFTYSFFGFSLMLPFLEESPKKHSLLIFLAIIFVPYLVTGMNDDGGLYYSSIFIDIPLGICCGYYFSHGFHPKNKTDRFCALLACGILVLLKDSGAFLALCGIAGCFLCNLKIDRKTLFFFVSAQLLLLLLAYGSWKYIQSAYGVVRKISPSFTVPSVRTLGLLFLYFIKTPVSGIVAATGAIHVSLPAALIMIFTAKLLLARGNSGCDTKSHWLDVAVQFVCYCGFFIGYCFSFLDQMEYQVYPSFVRYHCTLLICALYILAYDCRFCHSSYLLSLSREISGFIKGSAFHKLFRSAGAVLRLGMILCMVFSTLLILFFQPSKKEAFYVNSKASADIVSQYVEADSRIYLCMGDASADSILIQHRLYFELLDEGIYIPNYLESIDITNTGMDYTCDEFIRHLADNGYDYVLLTGLNDSLISDFQPIFGDITMEETNLIYRFDAANQQLIRIR